MIHNHLYKHTWPCRDFVAVIRDTVRRSTRGHPHSASRGLHYVVQLQDTLQRFTV